MKVLKSILSKSALLTALALLHVNVALAENREITVMAWGTTWEQALKTIAQNFTKKTGINVVAVTQSGSADGLARLQAMRDAPKIDVWFSTASLAARATADKKLFAPIPAEKLSNAPDLVKGARDAYWVGAYQFPLTIIYRPSLVKTAPKTWKDLWKPELASALAIPDVQTYPARMLLISAMINGGGIDNVEPGFAALKALKPNVAMYYGSDSDVRRALAQGEISAIVAPPNQIKPLMAAGLDVKIVSPVPSPVMFDVMTLVNTSKQDMALQFMNYVISDEAQAIITENFNMAPVNRKVKPAALLAQSLPKEADQVAFDEEKVNANVAAWNARFKSEIAK